ncbi:hypothetical protein UlMin_006103 [Ulmus minor]
MSRKRATLLAADSLAALSKVCSPSNKNSDSLTLNLLRNLSTATGVADYQNPNGYEGEFSVESEQNLNGFRGESQRKSDGVYGERSGNGLVNRSVGENGNYSGVYGQNSNGVYQKTGGVNRESYDNASLNNSYGKNGSFGGYYGQNNENLHENSNGFYQNFSGVHGESYGNTSSNKLSGQNGQFSGHYSQSSGVGYVKDNGDFQKNSNGFYHNSSGVTREGFSNTSSNNWSGKSDGEFQRSSNGFYQNSGSVPGERNTSSNIQSVKDGYYGQNNDVLQQHHNQNLANGSMQNPYASSQERAREMRQNRGGFDSQGVPGTQGSPNWSNTQTYSQFQQSPNIHYAGNVGMHQQNLGSGQYQQNQQPNSNALPNTMVGAQVPSDPKPEGLPTEASESRISSGTLEELDVFCKEGKVNEAVELLRQLEKQHISVDLPRYLQLIHICGEANALEDAKVVHKVILSSLSPLTVSTYNRILEMYSKCGSMEDAFLVFDKMPERNLTSWDVMITWLAKNDLGEDAIDLFTEFKKAGLKPDGQMFFGVFHACSVLGDVVEGMLHFKSMSKDFGIIPTMDHYVSVVNMLGSAGYLDEALEFIEKMPFEPTVDVWETLMNLCRVHGHLELGDRCAELVEQLEPSRLNKQSKEGLVPVKDSDLAKEKDKKKLAAQNLLEVRSRVHEYRAGDTSHPNNDKIYTLLRSLRVQMKEAGYIPDTRFVLHDIDQESKDDALLAHSERLACAHGLLISAVRTPIRVIKNLRVCGDCHNAMKIVSKIVGRELIMRDAKRFHHFKDGVCSCRDYW